MKTLMLTGVAVLLVACNSAPRTYDGWTMVRDNGHTVQIRTMQHLNLELCEAFAKKLNKAEADTKTTCRVHTDTRYAACEQFENMKPIADLVCDRDVISGTDWRWKTSVEREAAMRPSDTDRLIDAQQAFEKGYPERLRGCLETRGSALRELFHNDEQEVQARCERSASAQKGNDK